MKLTKEGIAVVEVDNYLSKDIEREGRLDVAYDMLYGLRDHIPEGGTVCDVGACLGDYTATFSEMVGKEGHVYAFEPHLPALECLLYNMKRYPNVTVISEALGSEAGRANVIRDFHNLGASQLKMDANGIVEITTLDLVSKEWNRLDFLKIDAEGFEPLIIDGAKQSIMRFRPVIFIEISVYNMNRLNMGLTIEDTYNRLEALDYQFTRTDGHDGDILCLPKERA